ncbi:UNVERIFIED_CONTAM: hypothetical protein Slati_1353600 [Sesamum latifolium]|uniref:RNase H type-1 domain-containing protein n=1 Tax=Sesamum latifolium TaxID=2727402 RepID=A0AAW2XJ86_9LAMI
MQIEGAYETRERTMMQYLAKVKEMKEKFDRCVVQQILRSENERANALSKFGAMALGVKNRKVTIMIKECPAIEEAIKVQALEEGRSWKDELIKYLKWGIVPSDPIQTKRVKFQAARFMMVGNDSIREH